MSIKISDLQRVADELFPQPAIIKDEALRRACVNRKYYATYHYLMDMVEQHFPKYIIKGDQRTFGKTGTHQQLFYVFDDIYQDYGNKDAQRISLKINSFLSKRHTCDYDLDENFDEFEYKQAIKYAEDIKVIGANLVKEFSCKAS